MKIQLCSLLCLLAACSPRTGSLVVVTVDSAGPLMDLARLRATVTHGSAVRELDLPLAEKSIPPSHSFSIAFAPDLRGQVMVHLDAFDSGDRPLGAVDGQVDLTPGGRVDLALRFAGAGDGGALDGAALDGAAGDGPGAALLAASTAAHDFGSALQGSSSAAFSVSITNRGGQPSGLLASAVTGAGAAAFSISSDSCSGVSLGGGESCAVELHFAPVAAGPAQAALSVSADPGGAATVDLTGSGLAPGDLAVAPQQHDFGILVLHASSAATAFTVTNQGGSSSGALTTSLDGADAEDYLLSADGCSGKVLGAAESCSVSVTFTPGSTGAKIANLTVGATPGGNTVSQLSGTGAAAASLSLTPAGFDFGSVVQGQASADSTFEATNQGGVTSDVISTVLAGANPDQFAFGANGCAGTQLDPGASCTIKVRCSPTVLGAKAATLKLTTASTSAQLSTLTGNGLQPGALGFTPASWNFGTVDATTTSISKQLTLTNSGGGPSGVITTAFTGATGSFQVVSDGCSGKTLAGGGSCIVEIAFAPVDFGASSLSVTASATPGGTGAASLTGTGRRNYTLTVTKAGNGSGTVSATGLTCSGNSCSGSYARTGSAPVVVITASPATGSAVTWSGACTGTAATCSVTMDAAKSVTATFALQQYSLTVTRKNIAGAAGTVTSSPSGVSCGATCTANYLYNSSVTLTATPTGTALFQSWGGDCSGSSPTCVVSVTQASSVTAVFRPPTNYVFVTSTRQVAGTLGGLAGADGVCNGLAQAAHLGGSYVAMLSTSTVSGLSRLSGARGWIRPDGLPFADTAASLFTASNPKTFYLPLMNELGGSVQETFFTTDLNNFVSTGTAEGGMVIPGATCGDWTSTAGNSDGGFPTAGGLLWTNGYGVFCSSPTFLYCFQTDYNTPITPAPIGGSVLFVSSATWSATSGVAAADSLCTGEAVAAGLQNAQSFKAVLATTTASASSRFNNFSGLVRPDGIQVAAQKSDLFTGKQLSATPNVTADGHYLPGPLVATGSADLTMPATAANNCNNWQDSTGQAVFASAVMGLSGQYNFDCTTSIAHVWCLSD